MYCLNLHVAIDLITFESTTELIRLSLFFFYLKALAFWIVRSADSLLLKSCHSLVTGWNLLLRFLIIEIFEIFHWRLGWAGQLSFWFRWFRNFQTWLLTLISLIFSKVKTSLIECFEDCLRVKLTRSRWMIRNFEFYLRNEHFLFLGQAIFELNEDCWITLDSEWLPLNQIVN